MKNLTLLIPAKNESESLPIVLDEIQNLNCEKKIILNANDTETIASIVRKDVKIIHQQSMGYGDALITGIKNTTTEYFCVFNADGSFNPSELPGMIDLLENSNSDFVFASRYQENSGSEDDTLITLTGNKIFTFCGKLFFRLPITDILYTFVLGKTNNAKQLNLKQKDFTLCVELPIKIKKANMKMISINSYERKRIGGIKKVNAFKDGFLILVHMIKLFFLK